MPGETETPTVQLKFVDAGDLYVTWRWQHAPAEPRVLAVPRALVQPALDALAAAIPTPRPGERLGAALERAFAGPLADRDREIALSESLARALIPARLAAEVNDVLRRGRRPHLRIQPSASLGRVPWESLRVDAGERMVHNADVSLLLPAGVRNAPGRAVSDAGDGSVVAVIDPLVPGGAFAPVLPDLTDDSPLGTELLALGGRLRGAERGELSRRRIDRDELRTLLAAASRLLYVGHVTGGSHGLDVRMHLSCDASTTGRAALLGPHRPLAAADLAGWRMPARVALLACGSGSDAAYAEPAGLVTAMVAGGAEHVTAARWTLPTDAAFAGAGRPFSDAAVAVARAHRAADPVDSLAAWQRERADAWERDGALEASPIVWAALTTAWAPPPSRTPETLA